MCVVILASLRQSEALDFYDISLPNGRTIKAEVAKSKAHGLIGRTSLCGDCGMVFIYKREWFYGFWMKNTLIPLAIIWIDSSGVIAHIEPNAEPCGNTTEAGNGCRTYRPQKPAKYILETNPEAAGGLAVGMKISSSPPLP